MNYNRYPANQPYNSGGQFAPDLSGKINTPQSTPSIPAEYIMPQKKLKENSLEEQYSQYRKVAHAAAVSKLEETRKMLVHDLKLVIDAKQSAEKRADVIAHTSQEVEASQTHLAKLIEREEKLSKELEQTIATLEYMASENAQL